MATKGAELMLNILYRRSFGSFESLFSVPFSDFEESFIGLRRDFSFAFVALGCGSLFFSMFHSFLFFIINL
jgi:hypothetical protein